MANPKARAFARWAADAAPALTFLVVLVAGHDFRLATWWLMGSSAVALAVSLAVERRLVPLPATVAAAAFLFGGLSLGLRRNDLLQMKMTVVDGLLGLALLGGVALKRNPLKLLMSHTLRLPERAWAVLAVRYGCFWWACAAANEIVRRTLTAEAWAIFRVSAIGAAIVFALLQTPYVMRHGRADAPPDPPEPGY